MTSSLDEERVWAQELESERDEFRERLEAETRLKENLDAERLEDIGALRTRVKELEEHLLKRDTVVQQCKNELLEKERIIKEKNLQLEERCRLYEELNAVSEKRKKQVDQLRVSIKTRDDALTDLNNKHRALLSQVTYRYICLIYDVCNNSIYPPICPFNDKKKNIYIYTFYDVTVREWICEKIITP